MSITIFSIVIVIVFGNNVLAYDFTPQDTVRGDMIVQRIDAMLSQKPKNVQFDIRTKLILELYRYGEQYKTNERLYALVSYVVHALIDHNNPSNTKSLLTLYVPGQTFVWNGATIMVTGTGIGVSSTTYPGCDTPDTAVWSSTGLQIWAVCNAGATTAYTGQMYPSDIAPTIEQEAWMGGYYQWGRNDDVTADSFMTIQYRGILPDTLTDGTNYFYQGSKNYGEWYAREDSSLSPARWNAVNG